MLLRIVITFWAFVPVDASPQFEFFSSLASEVLGVGQSIFSDISPNIQSPQNLPTPSSNLPVLSTAIPSLSPTPQTQSQSQASATTPSLFSIPQINSASTSLSSASHSASILSASSPLSSQSPPSSVISSASSIISPFHAISSSNVPNTSHTIGSQTSSSVSTFSAAISQRTGSPTSHNNAPGIVIGIILGIIGLFVILGLIWVFVRHRNKCLREGLDEHKLDFRSWNWKTVEDDENPSGKYYQPGSSNTVVQKPIPTFVAQRKYLPYRPQQYQQSPISSIQTAGASLMPSSSEMSEINEQPIATMPVELEGSMPSVKAQESAEDDAVKITATAEYAGDRKLLN